jgi:prolyl oligopeptidase
VVVPASDVTIQSILPAGGGFISSDIDGGDARARLFSATGQLRAHLPIPPVSVIEVAADPMSGPILFDYESYATPLTRMVYDVASNTAKPAPIIAETTAGDPSSFTVERVMVPSRDGKVKIPLEIVRSKSTPLDGTAPTILNAYGAYGVTNSPSYRPAYQAWLERGGIYARAMVRGGGEYGDAWHTAAYHATKTISSDDLASCADWLGAHGYASASHLGINGASAGGFLMGLALTRDPQRYRAVVSDVGIYDLLRFELTPNGAYNTPEFGTVRDPVQFAWMLKQSPYHNVVPGRAYPAVLMTTGANDPRVAPYNSRKMIARLQADSSSGYPLLLLQRADGGHGLGLSLDQASEQIAVMFTFFDSQLR